ncbi:flavin reductase [Nocardioides sp. NPDC127514]|uniref:flavin reductase n=1 Tax=unclassified Nocardioides TaxID=2615069 RepID=UPI0019179CF5
MSTTTHPELTPTQRAFRAAMSNLSAAVNIVTTDGPRGPAGITVSAACSVTDSPPTMLVCVNRSSYTHDFFVENKRVGINVLGAEHEPIAMRFAGASDVSMGDRLSEPEWEHDSHGVPVLRDAVATVIGRVADHRSHGSHTVLFVEVDAVDSRDDTGGLVYFQRRFHTLHPTELSA